MRYQLDDINTLLRVLTDKSKKKPLSVSELSTLKNVESSLEDGIKAFEEFVNAMGKTGNLLANVDATAYSDSFSKVHKNVMEMYEYSYQVLEYLEETKAKLEVITTSTKK